MDDKNSEDMTAEVDKPIEIELGFPGTSGYEWKPEFDSARLSLLERRLVPNLNAIGGLTIEVFRFCPLSTGFTEIKFDLARPWEDKPVEQVYYHIDIK